MRWYRRRSLVAAALVCALGWPGGRLCAAGRGKNWRWTAAQLGQVAALEKQVVKRADGFYVLTAGKFDVHTDISARFAAETSLFMEQFYGGFSKYLFETLGAPRPAKPALKSGFVAGKDAAGAGPIYFPRKPTVVIYSNAADYRKHFKNGGGGVFVHQYDGRGRYIKFHIYAYARTKLERKFVYFPISTLMHEGTHCLLQAMAGRGSIAPWFNEGFAQLVDSCSPSALMTGQLKPRGKFWRRHTLKYPGQDWYSKSPSLTRLLALKNWNVDRMGRETRYRYALACNFVEFLFSTDTGKGKLRVMLGRLVKRRKPLLNERDSWQVEQEWHTYLRKAMNQ